MPRLFTNFPIIALPPSFELNFQTATYQQDGSTIAIGSVLSISRASTGYAKTSGGTLTSFSNDTFRQTDLGLLVEDARTNLELRSQAFTTVANWSLSNATVLDNQVAAPDSTTTGATYTVTAGGVTSIQNNSSITISVGQVATISLFVKQGSGADFFTFYMSDGGGNFCGAGFNITTASVGSNLTGGNGVLDTKSIESFGNGWLRLIVSGHVVTAGTTMFLTCNPCVSADAGQVGVASSTQHMWGAQAEIATFATSYIPTTSASATRAADNVSIIGAAHTLIQGSVGTVFCETRDMKQGGDPIWSRKTDQTIYQGRGSATSNAFIYNGVSLQINTATFAGGKTRADTIKCAIGFDGSGVRIVAEGQLGDSSATAITDTDSTSRLGNSNVAVGFLTCRRLALWNSRLSDATLQSLTAP